MQVTCKSIKTTKDHFIKKGLIDSYYNILNLSKFREDNVKWTNFAKSTYNVDEGLIYLEENNGKKAVPNTKVFTKIDEVKRVNSKSKEITYQKNQTVSNDGIIASEKTIRDLAARIADRIGMTVKFESDRSKKYKGKIENNVAYVNLAHATLDTPIHEILGHPIIRAILKGNKTLYNNLLKELETGRGKEVLDRIKRDYVYKDKQASSDIQNILNGGATNFDFGFSENGETKTYNGKTYIYRVDNNRGAWYEQVPYTLEEQQEEAIVELLGLMTAEKLNAVKDGKLISLLKRLLKEMKQFVRSLLNQKEVEVNKLPDNMTLGDLSDLLAYSNSKIILPGYEVEYTTPDNMKFKTYAEASKHITELAKSVEDVDLSNIGLNIRKKVEKASEIPVNKFVDEFDNTTYNKKDDKWYVEDTNRVMLDDDILTLWNSNLSDNYINKAGVEGFIEKNKEYEQSKEIIEEWKKVNNIVYNPEEIYSRGQEFSSVVGAYSDFDVNLMMQNLLSHIEDNEKAGGKFAISAYTKPIDRKIGHLEGGGGKIKFKIYPKSEDILWAANTDVYSGSVWDASEKVNKDKKSELLGVSYTKYPSLNNVGAVQPNLANIIDDLQHHHNELGITLTGNNFRLEYDENIPYSTKKIIDSVNSILDQKYGKLVKPETKQQKKLKEFAVFDVGDRKPINKERFKTLREAQDWVNENYKEASELGLEIFASQIEEIGIQPTQTNETLKVKISDIKYDKNTRRPKTFEELEEGDLYLYREENGKYYKEDLSTQEDIEITKEEYEGKKEYTSQALINTKIAALKEAAKKYPRNLIRSEVKRINTSSSQELYDQFGVDELPFQKISKEKQIEMLYLKSLEISEEEIEERIKQCE